VKSLIVNADDLGAGPRRNEGILLAHRQGIVTSASALVQAPAMRGALDLLKSCPTLDAGLHLNLSEGPPVVPGHRTLVGPDGLFWGKDEARRRALLGLFDAREVERETDAQIAVLQDAGVRVTHLDGHHHLHVYGIVAAPAARAASRRGLRYVRRPGDTFGLVAPADERIEEYRRLGGEALKAYAAAGMRSTDHFSGSALSGRLDEASLVETLRRLPDGLTELMVHPGYADAAGGFAGPDREVELRALTAPGLRPLLMDLGIRLGDFGAP
jgi:chitin disaccharide deacetylase